MRSRFKLTWFSIHVFSFFLTLGFVEEMPLPCPSLAADPSILSNSHHSLSILFHRHFSDSTGSSGRLSPATIYRALSPAVVAVAGFNNEGKGELGAGSLVTKRGDVLTNAHVIMDKETGHPFVHLFIYYKPNKLSGDPAVDLHHRTKAKLERYNTTLDLALLRPIDPPPFPSRIVLANSSDVVPGQRVVAIGNPESGGLWSMTEGIISTRILDFEGVPGKNVFQTDAGMNRGNSGGPLIDSRGHMVGIDTAIARKAADGLAITSINFSLQSNVARKWIQHSGGWPDEPLSGSNVPLFEHHELDSHTENLTTLSSPPPPSSRGALQGLVTPPHPFRAPSVLEMEMKKLEDLGNSMHQDILKKLGGKATLPPN